MRQPLCMPQHSHAHCTAANVSAREMDWPVSGHQGVLHPQQRGACLLHPLGSVCSARPSRTQVRPVQRLAAAIPGHPLPWASTNACRGLRRRRYSGSSRHKLTRSWRCRRRRQLLLIGDGAGRVQRVCCPTQLPVTRLFRMHSSMIMITGRAGKRGVDQGLDQDCFGTGCNRPPHGARDARRIGAPLAGSLRPRQAILTSKKPPEASWTTRAATTRANAACRVAGSCDRAPGRTLRPSLVRHVNFPDFDHHTSSVNRRATLNQAAATPTPSRPSVAHSTTSALCSNLHAVQLSALRRTGR